MLAGGIVQRGARRVLQVRADYEEPSTTPLVEPQTATVGSKRFGRRVAFPLPAVQVQNKYRSDMGAARSPVQEGSALDTLRLNTEQAEASCPSRATRRSSCR